MNKILEEINFLKQYINYENYITEDEKNKIKKLTAKINIAKNKQYDKDKHKGKFYKNKVSHQLTNDDNIKNLLNKFTNKTYDKILPEIIKNMKKNITNDNKEEFINNIVSMIFNISINNKIYIEIYYNLLKEIINTFSLDKNIILNQLQKIQHTYHKYQYVNPEENYDDFCKINLINNNRKNLIFLLFYFIKGDFLDYNYIEELINLTINQFNQDILDVKKKEIVNEITEVIYILIYNYNSLNVKNNDYLKNILTMFETIIDEENIDDYPGISNKAIFKLEDLINDIKM